MTHMYWCNAQVGGTLVMRKHQTSFAIGSFLGVVAVMSQQCLIICAVFGGEVEMIDDDEEVASDQALAFFAFCLFAVYFLFACLLAVFRNDLIRDEKLDPTDPGLSIPEEEDLPPADV